MPRPIHEYMAEMAERIKADEEAERTEAALKKIETMQEAAEGERLTAEDRELLAWAKKTKAELDAEDDEDDEKAKPKKKGEAKPDDEKKPDEEEKPKGKTRPGRKSGSAYDWTLDEKGNVVQDGVAHIYSGPDEDDEVELPGEEAAAA